MRKYLLFLLFLFVAFTCEAKLPDIGPQDVTLKTKEIMKAHASHKNLTPAISPKNSQ